MTNTKALGKDLIFISRIKRDGSGTEIVLDPDEDMKHLDNTKFQLVRLSITQETYVASGFNSYVVKLKKPNT